MSSNNEEEKTTKYPKFKVLDNCPCHNWLVYSTALEEVCLILVCAYCGKVAIVEDPTREEWNRAFGAMMDPYLFDGDPARVKILPDEQQPKMWTAPFSEFPDEVAQ